MDHGLSPKVHREISPSPPWSASAAAASCSSSIGPGESPGGGIPARVSRRIPPTSVRSRSSSINVSSSINPASINASASEGVVTVAQWKPVCHGHVCGVHDYGVGTGPSSELGGFTQIAWPQHPHRLIHGFVSLITQRVCKCSCLGCCHHGEQLFVLVVDQCVVIQDPKR